jgi:hypothetical protein
MLLKAPAVCPVGTSYLCINAKFDDFLFVGSYEK